MTEPTPVTPGPRVPRREGRGFITAFGDGRLCTASGCDTKLSRYNDKDVCWAHDRSGRN